MFLFVNVMYFHHIFNVLQVLVFFPIVVSWWKSTGGGEPMSRLRAVKFYDDDAASSIRKALQCVRCWTSTLISSIRKALRCVRYWTSTLI